MKIFKKKGIKRKASYLLFITALIVTGIFGAINFKASEDNTPSHNKKLTNNGDGTYQLALDVTGDSDPEIETAANVNVVIVYDVSQSMSTNVPGTNHSRGDQAEDVVHDFIDNLAAYQDKDHPENIEMALVTFAVSGNIESQWTTDLDSINSNFDNGGTNGRTHFRYNSYGTNWQRGLSLASDLLDDADNDQTFVILVTDGAPTASGNGNNAISPSGASVNQLRPFYSAALPYAKSIQGKDNTTLYGIYIYGNEADLLDDLMYNSFVEDGEERTIGADTVAADNYFNASDTSQLQAAIDEIFNQVVQAMGISYVSISDGTTTAVKASSGTVNLLTVDESSYKYWLSMEVTEGANVTYTNNSLGSTITFTKNGDNYVGTWTDDKGSHSITGNIEDIEDPEDDTKTITIFKMEWTKDGNDLHSEEPPAAQLVTDADGNDSVDWDLSSLGVLLNGVTYTVTFDVWPTQYTYDLIADLENEKVQYSDLSSSSSSDYAGLDQYITKSLDGKYYLETNTEAILTYTDTREDNPKPEHSKYTNPPSVKTDVDKIDIIKKWENDYDSASGNAIQIIVNRETDGTKEQFYNANLDFNNNYTVNDVNIATGLMRLNRETGEVRILESGHDYSFEEVNGQHHRWEFVAQTVHPMLINGELKELILLDEASTGTYTNDTSDIEKYSMPDMPEGADYYDDGTYEYIKIDDKIYVITDAKPTIKAFNYRRSNLNLNKVVDGEAANPEELFEFKITVNDPGLEADEDLWFSIYDENNQVIIDENLPISDGWTAEILDNAPTGFYHGANNSTLTVKLKAGQNLRFTNLTTKATYTIIETGKENYAFTDANGVADYGKDHTAIDYIKDTDYKVDKTTNTITGSITMTNSTFSITALNTYDLASIDITKNWDDSSDKDGIRPDEIEIQVYRQIGETGVPEKFGEPVTITKDNVNANNPNQWNYTIESVKITTDEETEEVTLPRCDAEGNEYLYTVKETAVTGYQTTYNPEGVNQTDGKAAYTINNKHEVVPVNINITKKWVDNDNQDNKRPSSITVNIYGNGEFVKSETINGDVLEDTWTYTISGLDKYKDGEEITYTITENKVTDYEDPDIKGTAEKGFTIINTHNPSKISVSGTKTWIDNDNKYGRPDSITVVLHAKVGDEELDTVSKEVTANDNWKFSFDGLDEYKDGNIITYWITEEKVLDYSTSIDENNNITNTYTPETITIEGTKTWDDASDQDGKRPPFITVNLKNGNEIVDSKQVSGDGDQWSFKFENVIKYAKGEPINYTIEEVGVDGTIYTMSADGYNITNHHTPETISYKVTKNWEDYNNADQIRPDSITVKLYKIVNGVRAVKQTFTISAQNNWTYEFTNLPRYEGGKEITYDIVEDVVAGYVASYSTTDNTTDDGKEINTTITNSETIDINIEKIWEDNNDYDRIRPGYITVKLFANGSYVNSFIISKENSWKYIVEGLLKYQNGELIIYTIEEEAVAGYETTIDGYKIINTHKPEEKYFVEEMPPKTGVDGVNTNYILLVLITIIGSCKVLTLKFKNN